MRLRFATFNVRNGRAFDWMNSWPLRRRLTADTIAGLDADVVGLQEVFEFQRRYLDRRLDVVKWCGQGREGGREGEQCPVAVLDERVAVLDAETRWFGAQPQAPGSRLPGASFPRITTIVRYQVDAGGPELVVANVHLDEHLHDNRVASVHQLVEWLEPATPAVVLGDFNADPTATAVFRPLAEAGFQRAPITGGTEHRFTGAADGRQLDQIFFSEHWSVGEAEVVRTGRRCWRLPSDHWPVRAVGALPT